MSGSGESVDDGPARKRVCTESSAVEIHRDDFTPHQLAVHHATDIVFRIPEIMQIVLQRLSSINELHRLVFCTSRRLSRTLPFALRHLRMHHPNKFRAAPYLQNASSDEVEQRAPCPFDVFPRLERLDVHGCEFMGPLDLHLPHNLQEFSCTGTADAWHCLSPVNYGAFRTIQRMKLSLDDVYPATKSEPAITSLLTDELFPSLLELSLRIGVEAKHYRRFVLAHTHLVSFELDDRRPSCVITLQGCSNLKHVTVKRSYLSRQAFPPSIDTLHIENNGVVMMNWMRAVETPFVSVTELRYSPISTPLRLSEPELARVFPRLERIVLTEWAVSDDDFNIRERFRCLNAIGEYTVSRCPALWPQFLDPDGDRCIKLIPFESPDDELVTYRYSAAQLRQVPPFTAIDIWHPHHIRILPVSAFGAIKRLTVRECSMPLLRVLLAKLLASGGYKSLQHLSVQSLELPPRLAATPPKLDSDKEGHDDQFDSDVDDTVADLESVQFNDFRSLTEFDICVSIDHDATHDVTRLHDGLDELTAMLYSLPRTIQRLTMRLPEVDDVLKFLLVRMPETNTHECEWWRKSQVGVSLPRLLAGLPYVRHVNIHLPCYGLGNDSALVDVQLRRTRFETFVVAIVEPQLCMASQDTIYNAHPIARMTNDFAIHLFQPRVLTEDSVQPHILVVKQMPLVPLSAPDFRRWCVDSNLVDERYQYWNGEPIVTWRTYQCVNR